MIIKESDKRAIMFNRKYFWLFIVLCLLALTSAAKATTYEMPYYSDGADHFYSPTIYLTSGGTHTFSVDGIPNAVWPWTSNYNYVAYKDSGSGYSQIWSDSTSTGWDPSFSTYVNPGYKVKLVIRTGTTIGSGTVKSVYYWYIYQDNRPPYKASGPSPTHNSTNRSVTTDLDWSNASDPDGDSVSYKVYFGTDSSPDSSEYKTTTSSSYYNLPTLDYKQNYYWRIDTTDGQDTTTGDVWKFTTGGSLPQASRKSPTDSSVPVNITESQQFVVWGEDADGGLDYVKWYIDNVLKQESGGFLDFEGTEGDDAFSYTFNSAGTFTVKAVIYDDDGNTDYTTWTVTVNRDPIKPSNIQASSITRTDMERPLSSSKIKLFLLFSTLF